MNKRTDKDRNILLRIKSASFLFIAEILLYWLLYFITFSSIVLRYAIVYSILGLSDVFTNNIHSDSVSDAGFVDRTIRYNFILAAAFMVGFIRLLMFNLVVSCIGMALPVIWVAIYILIPYRRKISNWIRRKIKKKKP